jgi:4'-phosphopantetheinyl transferase
MTADVTQLARFIAGDEWLDDASVDVFSLRIDIGTEHNFEVNASVLSTAEQIRARRFLRSADRQRFVTTRVWLRRLLGSHLGVSPGELVIENDVNGRPYVAGECAESTLQFSVSHSGNLAVIAIGSCVCVGVDVEVMHAITNVDEMVRAHFSTREQDEFASLPQRLRTEAFFNGWTRKEALVKAWGCGVGYPLNDIDVSLIPGEPAEVHRIGPLSGTSCGWQVHGFHPAPGAVAAVAVPRKNRGPNSELKLSDLQAGSHARATHSVQP